MMSFGVKRIVYKHFTLCELLLCIAIAALLASLLLPAVARGRELASRTVCRNIMRQYMGGLHGYAGDHEGYFPSNFKGSTYFNHEFRYFWLALAPYIGNQGNVMRCIDRIQEPVLSSDRLYGIPVTMLCPSAMNSFMDSVDELKERKLYAGTPTRGGVYRTAMINSEKLTYPNNAAGGRKIVALPNPSIYFFMHDAGFNDGKDDRVMPYLYLDEYLDGFREWGHGVYYNAAFLDGHVEGFERKIRDSSPYFRTNRVLYLK